MNLTEFQNRLRYDHRTKSFRRQVPKTYTLKKRGYNKHVRFKDLYENIEWGLDWYLYHNIWPIKVERKEREREGEVIKLVINLS